MRKYLTFILTSILFIAWIHTFSPISAQALVIDTLEVEVVPFVFEPPRVIHVPTTGAQDPKVTAYIFADISETGFSGQVMNEAVPALLAQYPELQIKYIHIILPYRTDDIHIDTIDNILCLEKENAFWENINHLVTRNNQDSSYWNFVNVDRKKVTDCLVASRTQAHKDWIEESDSLREKYDVLGIPTAFIQRRGETNAITIPGAASNDFFIESVAALLDSNTVIEPTEPSPRPEPGVAEPPAPPAPLETIPEETQPKGVMGYIYRFLNFIKQLGIRNKPPAL